MDRLDLKNGLLARIVPLLQLCEAARELDIQPLSIDILPQSTPASIRTGSAEDE